MRHLLIAMFLVLSGAAVAVQTSAPTPATHGPQRTAASDTSKAGQSMEAEFWAAFIAKAVPGLSMTHVQPFANILAATPQKSPLLQYLGLALLEVKRPAESPYLGAKGGERLSELVSALRLMEKSPPTGFDTVAALQAFDDFFLTHTASLNLNRAALEILVSSVAAMHAGQYLRTGGLSAGFRGRWAIPVSLAFEHHARQAVTHRRYASAAGLYLYAHWVIAADLKPLAPVRYTDLSAQNPVDNLQKARRFAAFAAWARFWPVLDPDASETSAIVDILNRDPVLARANLVNVLGIVPGDAATFGAKFRVAAGLPDETFQVVAGNPPRWLRRGEAHADESAAWPVSESPGLRQARKQVNDARQRMAREIANYKESRRLWGLDTLRARLREFDGVRGGSVSSAESDSAQRALDSARASYSKDLRDGIYVGRSLERADTVYTREMNSIERRTREFEIERMERRLAEEQHAALQRHEETVMRSRQRDELTDKIFAAEKLVDTRGHLAKVAEIKRSIETHENHYAQLLDRELPQGSESGVSAEGNARALFVRGYISDSVSDWKRELIKQASTSRSVEDAMEISWIAWLLDFPETRENPGARTVTDMSEAQAEHEYRKRLGQPLAPLAGELLEPMAVDGPTRFANGLTRHLEPRFPPSAAWRQNQVGALLNDTWFRFAHEPATLREHLFQVVRALRTVTADDALTVEALRPWIQRFMVVAPRETQQVALSWNTEPQLTALISKAADRAPAR